MKDPFVALGVMKDPFVALGAMKDPFVALGVMKDPFVALGAMKDPFITPPGHCAAAVGAPRARNCRCPLGASKPGGPEPCEWDVRSGTWAGGW